MSKSKRNGALKIQLALQGGGAKMAGLIAVMQAIEELEAEGQIQITRVAGTSAGAVVGTLFAARVPMSVLRKAVENVDLSPFQGRLSKIRLFIRMYRGKPLWSEEQMIKELDELLSQADADHTEVKTLGALGEKFGVKVHLTATDIQEKSLIASTDDTHTVGKIVDSCALPFVIRNFKSPKATILDGGICENLPSELLYEYEQSDGPVIALSFETKFAAPPKNLKEYIFALIDTVVNRSTDRAMRKIPGRIHSIKTNIGTLDFDRAFAPEYVKKEHRLIKKRAKRFFRGLVQNGVPTSGDDKGDTSGELIADVLEDVIEPNSPEAIMMRRIGRIQYAMRDRANIVFTDYVLSIVAHGLSVESSRSKTKLDEVRTSMKMISETSDVWSWGFQASSANHEMILYRNECEVIDHEGNDVLAAVLPMSRPDDPGGAKILGFFFKSPLKPGMEPYDVVFIDTIEDFVAPLRDTGRDEFWISVSVSSIRNGKIILHVPKEFGEIRIMENEDSVGNGRPLSSKELSKYRKQSPIGFATYGWECLDIPAPGKFKIDVFKC